MINDNIKLVGNLDITVLDNNGNVKETRKEKNLVVTVGLGFITSRMKDATATAMTHMVVMLPQPQQVILILVAF